MVKKKKDCRSIFDEPVKSDFKTVKTSLKNIINNEDDNGLNNFIKINKWVEDCNEIVIIVYQFIRLYILKCFHENREIPELTEELLGYFVRACGLKAEGRVFTLKYSDFQEELDELYLTEFQPCLNKPKLDLINKKYTYQYLITQIHTSYYNNIKEHFITRFRRFVNLTSPIPLKDPYKDKKGEIKYKNNKENIRLIGNIKNKILLNKFDEIPTEFLDYSKWIRTEFLPELDSENYAYDVKVFPHKYMKYTIKMNNHLEILNLSRESDKQFKLFQPLPLRTNIIPKYITLDANCILNILNIGTTNWGKKYPLKQGNNRIITWNLLFNTDKKIFKMKDYHFKTIQTDGVGVSIIFQKIGAKLGKKITKEENKKTDMYINDLTDEQLDLCKEMWLVGGDPGKDNILYLMDQGGDTLRYTAPQRRKESYHKRYNSIVSNKKFHAGIIERETILSNYNSKTVNYDLYKQYINIKTELNDSVRLFYNDIKFRKFRWRTHIYSRKSEDKFLNNIKKTFGPNVLIGYGNWSISKQMKHIMPTRGIGMRRAVAKKYRTVLIDEFKTSKICSKCSKELVNLKDTNNDKVHRVLTCIDCKSDSSESKKVTFINRDINACINILNILESWIEHKTRPEQFSREKIDPHPKGINGGPLVLSSAASQSYSKT